MRLDLSAKLVIAMGVVVLCGSVSLGQVTPTTFPGDTSSVGSPIAPGASTTPSSSSENDISEKLANPIANLISVPFQFNYDANTRVNNGGNRLTMNFQPVVPIHLGDDWLLILRTIIPVIYQSDVVDDGGHTQFGLGDTEQSFFFAPVNSPIEHWTIGVGPIFLWPTGTNDSLGTQKWGAGPSIVALYQKNPWTIGLLMNHIWSFAGDSDRETINETFMQPFLTYQLGEGWSVLTQLEATYDWVDSQWTLPLAAGVSKVTKIGKLPVSLSLQGRYWLDGPDGAPEWGARFAFTVVLPE